MHLPFHPPDPLPGRQEDSWKGCVPPDFPNKRKDIFETLSQEGSHPARRPPLEGGILCPLLSLRISKNLGIPFPLSEIHVYFLFSQLSRRLLLRIPCSLTGPLYFRACLRKNIPLPSFPGEAAQSQILHPCCKQEYPPAYAIELPAQRCLRFAAFP